MRSRHSCVVPCCSQRRLVAAPVAFALIPAGPLCQQGASRRSALALATSTLAVVLEQHGHEHEYVAGAVIYIQITFLYFTHPLYKQCFHYPSNYR